MSTPIFYRRRAERFAQLLDETSGARHHHAHSTSHEDLAKLVTIGHRVSTLQPTPEVDPDFRADLRAMLIATAEREGIGATAKAGPAATVEPTPTVRRTRQPRLGHRARTRTAIVVGVAIGAITVSGISAASDNALPGDTLYGMKRSVEHAQLARTESNTDRGQLHLKFARIRLAEAQALQSQASGFVAVLDDMDSDTREGLRLLTTSAVALGDSGALDTVTTFLTEQRRQLTTLLERTPNDERDRVKRSAALLDSVDERIGALREAFACGAAPSGKTDDLGPLPGTCQPVDQ